MDISDLVSMADDDQWRRLDVPEAANGDIDHKRLESLHHTNSTAAEERGFEKANELLEGMGRATIDAIEAREILESMDDNPVALAFHATLVDPLFPHKGIVQNKLKAESLWRAAELGGLQELALSGSIHAQIYWACLVTSEARTDDFERAVLLLRCAASEVKRPSAQAILGWMYHYGHAGLNMDWSMAKELYLLAALQGHAGAQHGLGVLCEREGNSSGAAECFFRASEQGHSGSQARLADYCIHGTGGVEQSLSKALHLYRQAIHQNNSLAQYKWAKLYEDGEILDKCSVTASKYFILAGEQGFFEEETFASLSVEPTSEDLITGRLVDTSTESERPVPGNQNIEEPRQRMPSVKSNASQYVTTQGEGKKERPVIASMQPNEPHQISAHPAAGDQRLDIETALDLVESLLEGMDRMKIDGEAACSKLNEISHPVALAWQALLLDPDFPHKGVTKNRDKAMSLWRCALDEGLVQLARSGHVRARIFLGFIYREGRGGLGQSSSKATQQFLFASQAGSASAQKELATMYRMGRTGTSTLIRYMQAEHYYKLAAKQGHAGAQSCLAAHYQNLNKPDLDAALKLLNLAVDQGSPSAQTQLADLYRRGQRGLLEVDTEKSIHLYTLAAEHRFPRALFTLATLYEEGSLVDRNMEKANRLYQLAAKEGHIEAKKRVDKI